MPVLGLSYSRRVHKENYMQGFHEVSLGYLFRKGTGRLKYMPLSGIDVHCQISLLGYYWRRVPFFLTHIAILSLIFPGNLLIAFFGLSHLNTLTRTL